MLAVHCGLTVRVRSSTMGSRGGAGISKVVRPLQIKDQLYMCTGGGGGVCVGVD